ncbi:SRP54-type protein [Syncephalis fuscata]|nr:SRP54-type protein [Syncephalis fuscata]KAI9592912.1 SRP54-type protein [Syncephalis fuscata]
MLDHFTIFTRGGIVLWSSSFSPLQSNPVDDLVREVLVEERTGQRAFESGSYTVQWTLANELNLVFVAVYQKILQLAYVEDLLLGVRRAFTDMFSDILVSCLTIVLPQDQFAKFDIKYNNITRKLEEREYSSRATKAPRRFEETKKYQNTLEASRGKGKKVNTSASSHASETNDDEDEQVGVDSPRVQRHGKGRRGNKDKPKKESKNSARKPRVWDDTYNEEQAKTLDFSGQSDLTANNTIDAERLIDRSALGEQISGGIYNVRTMGNSDDEEDDDDDDGHNEAGPSGMMSFFQRITGQAAVTESDLAPVMRAMKEHLVNKNVAAHIADHLCESISSGIVGRRLGTFKSVKAEVKRQMETAVTRILTPRTSLDVLRDVFAARDEHRPYTMVFVGVNGVGKSTNLSKTCFWLLQNKLSVLIAACDTFRSGAVEQLRVHARNLCALEKTARIELYERGYGKDAAGIAKDAISYAKANKFDVVLVDTAGRMQDNEPLMRSLSKLVSVNNPDKIIFVGEALVGNEAVDQLTKFNQALKDFSGLQHPRQIDGIILTKFDTIDDKVGAALSMTFITGQPILFVGTGQTYTDLKGMNVPHVVQSLLRD